MRQLFIPQLNTHELASVERVNPLAQNLQVFALLQVVHWGILQTGTQVVLPGPNTYPLLQALQRVGEEQSMQLLLEVMHFPTQLVALTRS